MYKYMTVFIPYANPFKVAIVLDDKRLNRQIQEVCWILKGASTEAPMKLKNHPCYKMWYKETEWLKYYQQVLTYERNFRKLKRTLKDTDICPEWYLIWLDVHKSTILYGLPSINLFNGLEYKKFVKTPPPPTFLCDELLYASRCQLYNKDPVQYKIFEPWKNYTDSTWYVIDGEIVKYKQQWNNN